MILGFLVVTSVLVVTLGRLGDIYGRVRIYNLGFAVFTFFSLLLTDHLDDGTCRGHLADRHADLPGRGRGHADGQLGGHPDRRLSRRTSGVWRSGSTRRRAFSGTFIGLVLGGVLAPDQLAADLPRVGAHRAVRHRVGLPEAARARSTAHDLDRLARQHHLRRRAGPDHGGDHLRHRALRRPHHGLGESGGARRASASAWSS